MECDYLPEKIAEDLKSNVLEEDALTSMAKDNQRDEKVKEPKRAANPLTSLLVAEEWLNDVGLTKNYVHCTGCSN
jgi:hypothetical protein